MGKSILPVAAMEKLLKKAGASRVSEDAKEALRDILEEYSDKLGKKALELSRHSGRVTVKGSDIKLATK
jgi:histone H3/H4